MAHIVGIKVDLRISDKLDPKCSYVYVANHQNTYDLVTVAASARPGVVTVGKKSLKWIPIFGLIYWLSGNIMIDRKDTQRARGTLDLAAEKIRQRNLSIYMFPEGTRSRGKGILPFKTGAFRLAQATKQQVVPVCCSDTSHVSLNRWHNGTVIVEIMDPVAIDFERNPKDISREFESIIKTKFDQLSEEAERLSNKGNTR